MRNSKNKSWVFPTVAGIFLFALCLWLTEIPEISWNKIDVFWLVFAIAAQGGFAIPMPWRWKIISAGANVPIPYLPAFKITAYTSLAAAIVPQSLADLAGRGPWEARYTNCGLLNATNIILCDRLLDVFIIDLLLPPAMLLALKAIDVTSAWQLACAMILAGCATLFWLRDKFFLLFEFLFNGIRWAFARISFLEGKFNWHISPITLSGKNLAIVYALSILKFFVTAFATMAYFRAVNLEPSFGAIFFALPVTQLIFIFAFTPGGLGIFELGWVGILGMHGLNAQDVALFIVSQRICFTLGVTFWALVGFAMRGVSLAPKNGPD